MESETNHNRLRSAVLSVLDQCKEVIQNGPLENGPGMSLFRVIENENVEDEFQVRYYYVGQESTVWEDFVNRSPNADFLKNTYDPSSMFMVGVNVTVSSETDPDATIGVIKLFNMDTFEEVSSDE